MTRMKLRKQLKKIRMKLNNYLLKISTAPLAVLILHIFATVTGLYEQFWWFDIPMHFLGGAAIALAAHFILNHFQSQGVYTNRSIILRCLLLVGLVAVAAIAWENLEFLLDVYGQTTMQPSLLDTMKDMAMGLIGGSIVALILEIFFPLP